MIFLKKRFFLLVFFLEIFSVFKLEGINFKKVFLGTISLGTLYFSVNDLYEKNFAKDQEFFTKTLIKLSLENNFFRFLSYKLCSKLKNLVEIKGIKSISKYAKFTNFLEKINYIDTIEYHDFENNLANYINKNFFIENISSLEKDLNFFYKKKIYKKDLTLNINLEDQKIKEYKDSINNIFKNGLNINKDEFKKFFTNDDERKIKKYMFGLILKEFFEKDENYKNYFIESGKSFKAEDFNQLINFMIRVSTKKKAVTSKIINNIRNIISNFISLK